MGSIQRAASVFVVTCVAGVAIGGGGDGFLVGDRIRFFDREGNTGGGEFGVAKYPHTGTELIRTFCLERNEYLDFNIAGFYIESITSFAKAGGVGGGPNDPLDDRTAWLYHNLRNNTLVGYDKSNTTNWVASANALQNAIWKIEQEITSTLTGLALTFWTNANDAYNAGWRNQGRVGVMNITWATARGGHSEGSLAQSQLVLIPLPAGAGMAAVSVGGFVAWGGLRRRRAQGGQRL